MEIFFIVLGVILGSAITIVFVKSYAKKIMVKESVSKYSFEETVSRIVTAVEELGWKMPHAHDLQEILKKNGYDVRKVKVLEICKPEYAYSILSQDDERVVSSFLPCRIAVYELGSGKVIVNRMKGREVGQIFGGLISNVMTKAGDESESIVHSVLN